MRESERSYMAPQTGRINQANGGNQHGQTAYLADTGAKRKGLIIVTLSLSPSLFVPWCLFVALSLSLSLSAFNGHVPLKMTVLGGVGGSGGMFTMTSVL